MALIRCKECGLPVSDKAEFCPHCGVSVSELRCTMSSITEEPSIVTNAATIKADTNYSDTSKSSGDKPNKSKRRIIIYIIAAILFIVGTVFVINYIGECVHIAEEERIRSEQEEQARVVREQFGISSSQKVDLGLSVCWAGLNVGANVPEEYGDYFAWGEVVSKESYTRYSYKYEDGSDYIYIGSDICGTKYDVAHVLWRGGWRMPDEDEFRELLNRCNWTWITCNGVNGYKVTGPNGNSIFLPSTGCCVGSNNSGYNYGSYWSGTLSDSYECAYFLSFHTNGYRVIEKYRCYGHTVRPVCDK